MTKAKAPIDLRSVLADKPELVVHKADLTITARALAKLLAEKCDSLFVHDYKVVVVEPGDDNDAPRMRLAGCDEITIAAHRHCQPVEPKSTSERRQLTLPKRVAELYLAMPEEWRLRPLRGITTAPILHDDGSIRWELGYDAATGLLCACTLPALSLPDKPSREDANRALPTLRRAVRTFAFADRVETDETFSVGGDEFTVKVVDLEQPPGKDESAFLVALLTGVARFSLPLAPGYRIIAPPHSGSGVGKGKLAHAISIVAYGKKARAAALGERKEEFDKGLTDELLSGKQFILIDNLNNVTLRSRLLCAVLGEPDADVRRLGAGMEAAKPAFVTVTGNALKLAEDIVRRFITSELDAKREDPEQRRFAGDFLADITRQRAELLRAALIIWRFGRQAKLESKGAPPLGGFEHWTAWVRDPLVALGCQDPVARITDLKTSDPTRLETAEIFQTWWEHHGNDEVKANDLHDAVKALLVPDPNKRSRQNVASRVARLDGTRLAGFHLASNKESKGRWTPVSYQLEQVESESEQASDATPADEARPDEAAPRAAQLCVVRPEPDRACAQCNVNDGKVYLIRNNSSPNPAAAPLHKECARFYNFEEAAKAAPAPEPKPEQSPRASAPAPITAEEMDELRRRGFSGDDLFNMNPRRAREIIADPERNELTERYGKGSDAPPETLCRVCKKPGARYFSDPNTTGLRAERVVGVYCHLECAPKFFESGGLTLEDDETPAPAPEPEAATESEEDDPDGWQFNPEPDDAAARPEPAAPEAPQDAPAEGAPPAAATAQGALAEEKPVGVHAEEKPAPSDPLARLQAGGACLEPSREPCAGYRPGEWSRVHRVIAAFLAGPFSKQAIAAGWTELELFGVHPVVGIARSDACGALMSSRGVPVTQVTPLLIRFANGLAVYKARLSVGDSVAVWDYREPAANECATCRIGSPPWSEERNS